MYLIQTADKTIKTDSIVYIKEFCEGCYMVTTRDEAEGVCYNGQNFFYRDGVSVCKVDSGSIVTNIEQDAQHMENAICEADTANATRLANVENAMCEQDIKATTYVKENV